MVYRTAPLPTVLKLITDTKHRAASLRQQSYLFWTPARLRPLLVTGERGRGYVTLAAYIVHIAVFSRIRVGGPVAECMMCVC